MGDVTPLPGTLGASCTPPANPAMYILGGGILALLFLPGSAKLIGAAIAAYGGYGLACSSASGTLVYSAPGSTQLVCQQNENPACAFSL